MKPNFRLRRLLFKLANYLHEITGLLIGFNSSAINKSTARTLLQNSFNPIVIDVGCNVGDFISDILKVNQDSTFICFDMDPESGNAIRSRFSTSRISWFNLALSDESAVTHFISRGNLDRKAHLVCGLDVEKEADAIMRRSVTVTTLDAVLPTLGIERIDVLKIDTEGNDYKVLVGAKNVLSFTHIVIFEVMWRVLASGNAPDDALLFLRKNGFSYFYRLTPLFGIQPIEVLPPWQVQTQNIIASKAKLM